MSRSTYSENEIEKFLREVLKSELAINIFKQLIEDGGNTALGISENLKTKGKKASKTRVYEEISTLQKLGLIKRVSNRPPIYTTVPSQENFERIARLFLMDTREELMRRWAATYPFLSDEMKSTDLRTSNLIGSPIINFNPYPVVNIFNTNTVDLKKYLLLIFESDLIYQSNAFVDTFMDTERLREVFKDENYISILNLLKEKHQTRGSVKLKVLTSEITTEFKELVNTRKVSSFYQQFFKYVDFELREPKIKLSSFVISSNKLLYPIGIGGLEKKTYFLIEIRAPEILDKATYSFEEAWKKAKPIANLVNGKIVKE
jgi:hypothetical protein